LVELGYPVTEQEKELIAFYLPLHLHFIKEKTDFCQKKSSAKNLSPKMIFRE
jgi:hypothetical protein